jgi:hypothetical protein
MNDENNLEGRYGGVSEVLSRHLPGDTEENYERPQSE